MSTFMGYGLMVNDKPSGVWPLPLSIVRDRAKVKRLDASNKKVEIVQVFVDRGPPIDEAAAPKLKELA